MDTAGDLATGLIYAVPDNLVLPGFIKIIGNHPDPLSQDIINLQFQLGFIYLLQRGNTRNGHPDGFAGDGPLGS